MATFEMQNSTRAQRDHLRALNYKLEDLGDGYWNVSAPESAWDDDSGVLLEETLTSWESDGLKWRLV